MRPANDPAIDLECRDLCYEAGGRHVINRLRLAINCHGITTVMGPNGAGKSVLIKLIHGVIQPSEGIILWRGYPIARRDMRKAGQNMAGAGSLMPIQAMVSQAPVLLRRSVLGNLKFAAKVSMHGAGAEQISAILSRLKLSHLVRQPARVLSGGERQRLALARALLMEPELLFLDEPCANLDPASTAIIEEVLGGCMAEGKKIILVTHDIGQAKRLSTRIVFLQQGQVREVTSAAEFFRKPKSSAGLAFLRGEIVY